MPNHDSLRYFLAPGFLFLPNPTPSSLHIAGIRFGSYLSYFDVFRKRHSYSQLYFIVSVFFSSFVISTLIPSRSLLVSSHSLLFDFRSFPPISPISLRLFLSTPYSPEFSLCSFFHLSCSLCRLPTTSGTFSNSLPYCHIFLAYALFSVSPFSVLSFFHSLSAPFFSNTCFLLLILLPFAHSAMICLVYPHSSPRTKLTLTAAIYTVFLGIPFFFIPCLNISLFVKFNASYYLTCFSLISLGLPSITPSPWRRRHLVFLLFCSSQLFLHLILPSCFFP